MARLSRSRVLWAWRSGHAVGERIVRDNAGDDHRRPVAVELVVQADQVGSPPTFGQILMTNR